MIALLLSSLLWAKHPCYGIKSQHPDYEKVNREILIKVVSAAELVNIASEADAVLSKLIAAKSPVLMNWLKKRELLNSKEEIIAKEWRRYYLDNFILGQFPTKNELINASIDNLFKEVAQVTFDEAFKKRLEKLLNQVKRDAKSLVESWAVSAEQKKIIIHKLEAVQLYWFDQLLGSRYESKPLEFIRWGLAYDPPKNEINVGVHAKKYPTDASLYTVLAHEMGHAIDSCRWSSYFQGPSPFANLYQCLRSKESTGALTRDDSKMEESIKKSLLTTEMAQSLKLNTTCNRSFYPPVGTQKDQLPEVFADWFATEVYAKSSFMGQFPRPDLCDRKKVSNGSSYLDGRDRIDKIYFSQPEVAKKMNVEPKAKYCSL